VLSGVFCINVRLNFFWKLHRKDVRQVTPVLFESVLLIVQIVVDPVVLIIRLVVLNLEVPRSVLLASACVIPSVSSLPVFKSVFFKRSRLHVSVLKSPLVRSSSCISWSNYIMQSFWEVVKLNTETGHSVHRFYVNWIRCFFPDLSAHTFLVNYGHLVVPVTLDGVHYLFVFTFKLVNFAD